MSTNGKRKKQKKKPANIVYIAPDGTVISKKDWEWLVEHTKGTNQAEWLKGYKKWKKSQKKKV